MPKSSILAWIGPLSLLSLTACNPGASDRSAETVPQIAASTDGGARLAAACAGCHSSEAGAIASLEGYSEAQLVERMNIYRSETDGTTVMHRLARGYSDEDIALISAYLSGAEAG